MSELTATLVIGITRSECGHCRKPTLIEATRHTDVSGYDPRPGGGCGAYFVSTRSGHSAITDSHLREVRPDLPIQAVPDGQCPTCGTPNDACAGCLGCYACEGGDCPTCHAGLSIDR